VCNLEDFDFFGSEIPRIRENDVLVQSGVVDVNIAKGSLTLFVCVAVIPHSKTTKAWTVFGITYDCQVRLFALQPKYPRRDVVQIFQRESETQHKKHFDRRMSTLLGIKIDSNDEYENVSDSIRVKCGFDSNVIDKSD
jgi:hypothetical protein